MLVDAPTISGRIVTLCPTELHTATIRIAFRHEDVSFGIDSVQLECPSSLFVARTSESGHCNKYYVKLDVAHYVIVVAKGNMVIRRAQITENMNY